MAVSNKSPTLSIIPPFFTAVCIWFTFSNFPVTIPNALFPKSIAKSTAFFIPLEKPFVRIVSFTSIIWFSTKSGSINCNPRFIPLFIALPKLVSKNDFCLFYNETLFSKELFISFSKLILFIFPPYFFQLYFFQILQIQFLPKYDLLQQSLMPLPFLVI